MKIINVAKQWIDPFSRNGLIHSKDTHDKTESFTHSIAGS